MKLDKKAVFFKINERSTNMLTANGIDNSEFLEYKGRPLVRKDNDIYYGDLSDNYHVFMMIMDEKPSSKGMEIPKAIMVQLRAKNSMRPEKQTISPSFTDALETAAAWLERYNK